MEFLFEVIFQFLGEILLQVSFELLAELGLRSLADTFKKPRHPVLSTFGFILWGAIAGAISLMIFPTSPIINPDIRKINLIITPMVVGAIMTMVGKIRERRDQNLVPLDRFSFAFIFAFTMSLVRFLWVD